jgi:uncharacterized membrane protein YfcA
VSTPELLFLAAAALAAGTINGLLGYGFSSLMIPTGLLLAPVRLLNPALVLVELPLNAGAALIHHRRIPGLWRELRPFALALLPGIALGALLLRGLPAPLLKLVCYGLLLPLVLLQIFARPPAPRPAGLRARTGFGFATGLFYGLTTISGPTLALYAHRRGYAKDDARAALSILRAMESVIAFALFAALGLFTTQGLRLALFLLPFALLGLWAGHSLATRVEDGRFRRLALHFNLLAVAVGLARALVAA